MKILWAFDPFLQNKDLQKKAKKLLKSLLDTADSVMAVYVASNSEVNLTTAYNIPKEKRFYDYPLKILKKELGHLGLRKMACEVLSIPGISLGAAVKELSRYAEREDSDLILLASNGKKTLPRIVMGSFAETLIHLAKNDVLIYHQKTNINFSTPHALLYAHDFTVKGTAGLVRALIYAKKWGSRLIVVHVAGPESEDVRQKLVRQSQKLEKSLNGQGVSSQVDVVETSEDIAPTLISIAKKEKANIIITAAKSSNLASFLGGNVTRKILRESPLLTLVIKV